MCDVVALGELVIDFSPEGVSVGNHALYERQSGGAPSNVLATVARLGGKAAIIGMVGDDSFDYYLKDMAENCSIDYTGLCFTGDAYTTLTFVHLDSGGKRSFTMMRKPGADTQLRKEQVRTDMIKQTGILHISAAAPTDEPCRGAAFYVAQYARQEKKPVSFDTNYRDVLWDREKAIRIMKTFLPLVDILKVSEEETTMLTDTTDIPQGVEWLYGGGVSLVIVTCGEKDSYYCYQGGHGLVPAYQVQAVDINGAGDAFLGTLLYELYQTGSRPEAIPLQQMEHMIKTASAADALYAARPGALVDGPVQEEIRELMGEPGQQSKNKKRATYRLWLKVDCMWLFGYHSGIFYLTFLHTAIEMKKRGYARWSLEEQKKA